MWNTLYVFVLISECVGHICCWCAVYMGCCFCECWRVGGPPEMVSVWTYRICNPHRGLRQSHGVFVTHAEGLHDTSLVVHCLGMLYIPAVSWLVGSVAQAYKSAAC